MARDDAGAPADEAFAIVGRVRKAHGVRGELVIELLTDEPDAFFASGRRVYAGTVNGEVSPGAPTLTVREAQPFKGGLIVRFDEITDRDVADTWRRRFLLVPLGELPEPSENEVYLHDLPGLAVSDAGGRPIGVVRGWFEVGPQILLEIERQGTTILVPWRLEFVHALDVKSRTLILDLPEGLIEDSSASEGAGSESGDTP
jgi:16S rRNA processing protein RimM